MNELSFSSPQRQSTKGLVLFFLISTRKFIKALWPVLIYLIIKNNDLTESLKLYIYIGGILLIVVILLNAVLTFINFWFYIENGEFVVKKGYLKKVKLTVPLDRIQTINQKQNIFQKILNVVSLEIDTAGSAQKELKLVALSSEQALALQKELGKETDGLENKEDTTLKINPIDSHKPLFTLQSAELLKIGLSENHIRSALFIIAVVSGFFNQLQDLFFQELEVTSEEVTEFLITQSILFISTLTLLILFAGFVFSILNTFLKFFDFQFIKTGKEFTIVSGLLTRKTVTIPYTKIQVVSWMTNPIRKLMNFVTVTLTQASSNETNKKLAISIPGCNAENKQLIDQEIFGKQKIKWDQHHSQKSYIVRLWFLRGWLISLLVSLNWGENLLILILAFTWLIVSLLLSIVSQRKRYFRISPDLILISKGTIGQQFAQLFNYKIQSIKLRQTIFQRRKKLASIKVYTAGGKTLSIPFIKQDIAMDLYNFLLYKIESTNERWM